MSKSNLAFFLIFLLFSFLIITTGIKHYYNFYFTSDGFHHYSLLRNFLKFNILWEGPTWEYTFGNHVYITLLFLTPFIAIFNTPLVLLFANIFYHLFSSIMIYLISYFLFKKIKYGNFISFLFAVLYILSPQVFNTFYISTTFYQPDFFIPPLVFCLFYAFLHLRKKTFLILSSLIILTKEEYIVLYPTIILCFFLIGYLIKNNFWNSRFIYLNFFVYFFCTLISLTTWLYFRTFNEINMAIGLSNVFRSMNILIGNLKIFNYEFFLVTINTYGYFLLPVIFILLFVIIISKISLFKKIIIISIIIIYPTGRFFINTVMYSTIYGSDWHNSFIPPILIITSIVAVHLLLQEMGKKIKIVFSILFLLIKSNLLLIVVNYDRQVFVMIKEFLNNDIEIKYDFIEINELKRNMTKDVSKKSYFITEEHLIYPFIERSHVAKSHAIKLKNANMIFAEADYIIFRKNEKKLIKEKKLNHTHKIILVTKNFILYEKNT